MQKLQTKRSTIRSLSVSLATSRVTIENAQRLRYQVFSEEYGASFGPHTNQDVDHFDTYCAQLVVQDEVTGEIAATTRILTDEAAKRTGGFYSETEFDLTNLKKSPHKIMEIGRTCVSPNYRNGATLSLLWSGITRFLVENNYKYMIGCGSISMQDGGRRAWAIAEHLKKNYLAPPEFFTIPVRALPHLANHEPAAIDKGDIPALLSAYMRLGAKVCGDPCWDPDFKCADLLILLDIEDLPARYKKHYLKNR